MFTKLTLLLAVWPTISGRSGAAAAQAPLDSTRHAFVLNSTGSTYPFVAALSGTYRVYRDSIVVDVDTGVVRSNVPRQAGEDGVARQVEITIGLGDGTVERWEMKHDTAPQAIVDFLLPEREVWFRPLHFVVQTGDSVSVVSRWLVAQVRVQQRLPRIHAGLLTSYACAEDYVLGPTAASRERAAAQRTRYAQVC